MQQDDEVESRGRARAKRRFSLILQDLEYQLMFLSASVAEPPRTQTPNQEEAFTRIDTTKHWAIRSPLDEYREEPQESRLVTVFFNSTLRCFECDEELDSQCQIYRGKALCSQCFLTTPEIAVCCACHHTIEDRVVLALGKVWHPHHLKCSKCEEILSGGGHFYERDGEPLCFHHFRGLTQEVCHKCHNLLPECLVEFTNKLYCLKHFTCEFCDKLLQPG
ncbi:unnamed protein product [Hydatigera taeniaeformis]|uniref:LIM zinc-binding domain-containing protein n=1 Tax=Hydatigena taeniaeformis TaxID=6205 RepID=A0A0R3WIG7_HYDTA|nr:unnamed protein product [Hydatigera taeniaeformis]